MKLIWMAVGAVFLVLGFVGLLLPVVPTVPFVIIASYCFMKGNPRIYQWMLHNKTFGPMIRDWEEHGAIAPKTKVLTTVSVAAAMVIPILLKVNTKWLILEAVIIIAILVFVWTRPNS